MKYGFDVIWSPELKFMSWCNICSVPFESRIKNFIVQTTLVLQGTNYLHLGENVIINMKGRYT